LTGLGIQCPEAIVSRTSNLQGPDLWLGISVAVGDKY
jgi:hypothetical protein